MVLQLSLSIWYIRYMSATKMDTNLSGLLFKQSISQKNTNCYVFFSGNKGISYYRSREIFLEALKTLGQDSKLFGLQSLRYGEATAAVISLSGPVSDRSLNNMEDGNLITPKTYMLKRICRQDYQYQGGRKNRGF